MPDSQLHIQDSTLQAWMSDSLSDAENAKVEKHLASCPQCTQRLEHLEQPDDIWVLRLREMLENSQLSPQSFQSDTNLLFGTLALQSEFISEQQFVEACTLWSSSPKIPLSEVLVRQGWLSTVDHQKVQELLDKHLHGVSEQATASGNIMRETLVATSSRTVSLPPLASERIDLEEIYSGGGIGQIWRAHDNILGRELALKELLPEKVSSLINRERFFREARITAQLTHPGTPPVYEYVEENGRCWYTMKFIHGQTLTESITQYHHDNSESDASIAQLLQLLTYFVAICNTIAYAHSKKILHRDIKSENVVIGEFGEVIVLDWGLAKNLHDRSADGPLTNSDAPFFPSQSCNPRETIQGERLGTPAFMAPEQALGLIDQIDYRTDVYGLAGMLYEILTGRAPFEGNDIWQVLKSVECDIPEPPQEIHPNIPTELADICLQGLAKKKNDRQQSATEIGEVVQSWIVDQAHRKQTDKQRQAFFDLSMDLQAIHDDEFRLRQTNRAWETILGWTREDLDKMTIWDILHPDDHEIAKQRRPQIRAGEPLSKLEYRCRCKDGSYKLIRWSTIYLKDEQVGYSVGHDISDITNVQCHGPRERLDSSRG